MTSADSPRRGSLDPEYTPAAHTAAVTDAAAIYVVDLRDSRVLRLAGLGAIAWEWAAGTLPGAELAELLSAATDVDADQLLAGIRSHSQTLHAHGLLTRA